MSKLGDLFPSYDENRAEMSQSSRRIMIDLAKEIINCKIEIEGLKQAVQSAVTDSNGDTHDHSAAYNSGKASGQATYNPDLIKLQKIITNEEDINDEFTGEYKNMQEQLSTPAINVRMQMQTDANRMKQYDYVDSDEPATIDRNKINPRSNKGNTDTIGKNKK